MNYQELETKVLEWADDKGILDKATPLAQAKKTLEEVQELLEAVSAQEKEHYFFTNTKGKEVATVDESGMFDALQAPSSGFILPEADISRYTNQAMEIYGQGRDTGQQMTNSINQAIFGNNLQDVRIENVQ